ncbi:MAG: hypothetical protein WAV18_23835 [Roseiarcus sp.]
MTLQSPATPPAVFPWAAAAFVVVLMTALAITVIRFGASEMLSVSNPALALWFDPSQSDARVTLALSQWLENVDRSDEAISEAREALADTPLSPGALILLARVSEHNSDPAKAAALMQLASRVDQRSLEAQLWLLNQDIQNARIPEVLRRMDVLLRGQTAEVTDRLSSALAPVLTSEAYRPDFVAVLETRPTWRSHVLESLAASANDLAGLDRLYASLRTIRNPLTAEELEPFLKRLVKEGRLDDAYIAWTQSLPPERLSKLDYLYNGRFQYTITNLPFDWVFAPVDGALARAEVENGRRILDVDFFGGRVAFQHVSHFLTLSPGSYRFSGQERSQNLQNERGLGWRLACVGGTNATLGATELLTGETPWREFRVDFEVPKDNCPYQKLVLELPARAALETEIIGGVSYGNLEIKPN